MLTPFADASDIETVWVGKTFTVDEQTAAQSLIVTASAIVRAALRDVGQDVDARISSGSLDEVLVRGTVVDMVKRVMKNPDALRQYSRAIDDRVESGTYDTAVSSAELYMTDRELQRLTGRAARARAFTITPRSGVQGTWNYR